MHPSFSKHSFELVFNTTIKDEEEDESPMEAEVDTDILKTIST